jgi:hypothetical protein
LEGAEHLDNRGFRLAAFDGAQSLRSESGELWRRLNRPTETKHLFGPFFVRHASVTKQRRARRLNLILDVA